MTRGPFEQRPQPKKFDWVEMHRRLSEAARATDAALAPSSTDARRILDERARTLAQPLIRPNSAGEEIMVVMFTLANENYAIEARYVRYVTRMDEFTAVPGTPASVIGVVNQRGEILPVFDLRIIVGIPAHGLTDLSRLVVCGERRDSFGFLADDVREVTTISAADLRARPESVGVLDPVCVRGVTADAVILLDAAALFRDRRLFAEDAETR